MKNYWQRSAVILTCSLIGVLTANAQSVRLDTASFRHLPPDAFQVIRINLPHLLTKVNWLDFSPVIPGLSPSIPGGIAFIDSIKNLKDIGVNVRKPVFVATGFNLDSTTYTSIIFRLSDSGRFAAWLQKVYPSLHSIYLPGGHAASIPHITFAWNDQLAVVTLMDKTPKNHLILRGYDDTFFTTDTAFMTAFSGGADLQVWAPGTFGLPLPRRLTKKEMQPGLHAIASIGFLPGGVIVEGRAPLTSLGESRVPLFTDRSLPEKWLAPFSPDELLGFVSLQVDIPVFVLLIDSNNPKTRTLLALINSDPGEITRAFRGDMMVAAVRSGHPADKPMDKVGFYLIATVRDSLAFSKLANTLHLSYALRDSIGVIGSDPESVQKYLNAPSHSLPATVIDPLRNNPLAGTIDLKALRITFPTGESPGAPDGILATLLKLRHFNRLSFTVGYTAHSSLFRMELVTGDPGYNSLQMLINDVGN